MNKKTKAGIAIGLVAILGGLYALLRRTPESRSPAPSATAVPSRSIEPAPQPSSESVVTSTTGGKPRVRAALAAAPLAAAPIYWQSPVEWKLLPPAGAYLVEQSFTPATNFITGMENYGGYAPCAYNHQTGFERYPCAFVFPDQRKRWLVLAACRTGVRPGNPPQCYCVNGYSGNSGKCR